MRSTFLCRLLVGGIAIFHCGLTACDSPSEDEVEAEFAEFVSSRDDCVQSDDCAIAYTECPLGCSHAVNAQYVASVESKARELIDEYESGGSGCDYRCVQVHGAVCQQGTCTLQLEAGDGGVP